MKYRILVLLVLMCAVLIAAVGGTLAGYTSETTFSFSIRPYMRTNPHAQPVMETSGAEWIEQDMQSADIDGIASDQAESNISPDALQQNK